MSNQYTEPSNLALLGYRLVYDPLRAGYLRGLVASLQLDGTERVLDFGSGPDRRRLTSPAPSTGVAASRVWTCRPPGSARPAGGCAASTTWTSSLATCPRCRSRQRPLMSS